jgi:hypothetical protein
MDVKGWTAVLLLQEWLEAPIPVRHSQRQISLLLILLGFLEVFFLERTQNRIGVRRWSWHSELLGE